MPEHKCDLPPAPSSGRTWICPRCQRRYRWSGRMIGREMRQGWVTGPETHEDRVRKIRADHHRAMWWIVPVGVLSSLAVVALVVWVVLRVTS